MLPIFAVWLSGAALGLFGVEFLGFNQDFLPPKQLDAGAALMATLTVAPLILAGIWVVWSFLLTRMTGLSLREALVLDAPTYLPLLLLGSAPLLSRLLGAPVAGNHAAVVTLVTTTVCGVTGWKALIEGGYVNSWWRAALGSRAWVIGGVILFFLVTGGLTMARYGAHNFWGVDLAQFDQALWNTWHGNVLGFTQYGGLPETLLTDHFEPIMLLVAPLYLIWPDPRALLILQAGALALGGWLVYRLALSYLVVPLVAVCAAFAYLAHPGVVNSALAAGGSFRPDSLTVPLFLAALLALEYRRWVATVVLVVLAMMCKEYIALVVIPLGFYVIYHYRRPGLGVLLSALGVVWFVGVMFVVMPALRGGSGSIHFALNFGQMGGEAGAGGIAETLLREPRTVLRLAATQPDILALFFAFLSLAFLPIFHAALALVGLPIVAMFALTTVPDLFEFHLLPALPFFFAAALVGVANLSTWIGRRTHREVGQLRTSWGVVLLSASLAAAFFWSIGPLGLNFWSTDLPYNNWRALYVRDAHDARLEAVVEAIPPDAVVLASDATLLGLGQRPVVYHFFDPPPAEVLANAPWVVIDLFETYIQPPKVSVRAIDADATGHTAGDPHLAGRELYAQLLASGDYRVETFEDGILVLKRRAAGETSEGDPFTANVVDVASPTHAMQHDFGERLQLLGYDLTSDTAPSPSGERYRVAYYWQVLDGFDAPFQFRYGINPKDHVQERTDENVLIDTFDTPGEAPLQMVHVPTFLLLPPSEWRVGMVIKEEIEFSMPPGRRLDDYRWQTGLYVVPEHFAIAAAPERLTPGTQLFEMRERKATGNP